MPYAVPLTLALLLVLSASATAQFALEARWTQPSYRGTYRVVSAPDGEHFYSFERGIVLRRTDNLQVERTLRARVDRPKAVAVSLDRSTAALQTNNMESRVELYNLGDGSFRRYVFPGHYYQTMALSPDGAALATSHSGGPAQVASVYVTSTTTGERLAELGYDTGLPIAVSFSNGGDHVAALDYDGRVRVWNWRTAELVRSLEAPFRKFYTSHGLEFTPDDQRIVIAGDPIRVWRWWDGGVELTLQTDPPLVHRVAVSADGAIVAGIPYSGPARVETRIPLWSLETGELLGSLTEPVESVGSAAFCADGALILGGVRLGAWDYLGQTLLHSLDTPRSAVSSLSWSPDGVRVAATSRYTDRRLTVFDHGSGETAWGRIAHQSAVGGASFSPDGLVLATCGSRIASGSPHGEICLWDSSDGSPLANWGGNSFPTFTVGPVFSPDGTVMLVGDLYSRLFRVQDCQFIRSIPSALAGAIFSPDGQTVASYARRSGQATAYLRLTRVSDDALVRVFPDRPAGGFPLAMTSNGDRLIASDGANRIQVWNVADAELVSEFSADGVVSQRAAALTRDDAYLIVGQTIYADYTHGIVRAWRIRDGTFVGEFTTDSHGAPALSLSPDGATLVIGDEDANVSGYAVPRLPPADLDGDGDVDLTDLLSLLRSFGACVGVPSYEPMADFDRNGCVDLRDLSALLSIWGA
ncbi:MAG: hypothetical protein HZB38_05365 [Planctomycetes bacterium]|nr:hypothetical protein [Planctomycetota bacterium]